MAGVSGGREGTWQVSIELKQGCMAARCGEKMWQDGKALAGKPAGVCADPSKVWQQQILAFPKLTLVPCPLPSYCRLVVAEGGEDVTIKVSDEGGGT